MALVAENISFWFEGGARVLSNASLTIAPGEIVTLAGASGSGKSTFGRILAAYIAPSSGKISIDDVERASAGFHPVQIVHQAPEQSLDPRWTVGRSLFEGYAPSDSLCGRFGIRPEWLRRYPHELSAGQLQRVAIVRILAPEVRYVVADEISTMLDPIAQAEIWRAIQIEIAERAIGVLAITHNAALAKRLSERHYVLQNGCLQKYQVTS